jgi:hypothetical protein
MPIMPRSDKKAQRIAFNILGKPANMKKRRTKKFKESPEPRTNGRYEELIRISVR